MSAFLGLTSLTLTKSIAIGLAIVGLACGLTAAWYRERSTRVRVDPLDNDAYATVLPKGVAPNELGWTGQFRADQEIRRLNTLAARWTAQLNSPAVVLGALSSVVGLF